MKTAMQEVLNLVKQMFYNADALKLELPASMLNDIINIIIQEGIPKEKEQIIKFCWECLKGDNIHTITSNKELIEYINDRFNQTYNQT